MLASLAVGDSVVTTSGFYGVVVDKVDEHSFMAISDTSEILGSGFRRIEI